MSAIGGLYKLYEDAVAVDWPTFHHDNKRTGFTLVRGDMDSENDVDRIDLALQGNIPNEGFSKASAADIDGDGEVEIVVSVSDNNLINKIFAVEYSGSNTHEEFEYDTGERIDSPPTLANIDGDSDKRKEIIYGTSNGNITALDISYWGNPSHKWTYTVLEKYSSWVGQNLRGETGFTAAEDMDNDGQKEIIFTDGLSNIYDWPGEVYILEDMGNYARKMASYTIGNGGGNGAVSIADVDNDGLNEMIVTSFYEIFRLDFDGSSTIIKNWSYADGKIDGSAVIFDIDSDGVYEVIYTTFDNAACHPSKTCYNKLYIRDAITGNNIGGSPISLNTVSRLTPSIADIDEDKDFEIILIGRDEAYSVENATEYFGDVFCYEVNGNICSGWPYSLTNSPYVSPSIADIDNDGKYEIMFPEWKKSEIYVLSGNGNLQYKISTNGEIGSALAIGDFDQDNAAEIAIKRAGSPMSIFTTFDGLNKKPLFEDYGNITGIAGEEIDISDIIYSDVNNDSLTISYGSPFNQTTGIWQTDEYDVGDYSVIVEVSDGNLSSFKKINLKLFELDTTLQDNFDGDFNKTVSFVGAQTKEIQFRIPKNSNVVHSSMIVEGSE